jgi:hypothetical protein
MTNTRTPPRINLVVRDNGLGLTRDAQLLADALKANGCDVHVTSLGEKDEQLRWRHGRGRRVFFRDASFSVTGGMRGRGCVGTRRTTSTLCSSTYGHCICR